jgi:hypothetical protein
MAQTAIEYLIEQYKINPYDCMISTGLFAKALEIEKQNLENAWMDGIDYGSDNKDFEDFYNKTYNNATDLAILLEKEGEKYNL